MIKGFYMSIHKCARKVCSSKNSFERFVNFFLKATNQSLSLASASLASASCSLGRNSYLSDSGLNTVTQIPDCYGPPTPKTWLSSKKSSDQLLPKL